MLGVAEIGVRARNDLIRYWITVEVMRMRDNKIVGNGRHQLPLVW
jgi:hypothetical protein